MEHNRSPEEAERLVKKYPNIIIQGIMNGANFSCVHSVAQAIEIKESE